MRRNFLAESPSPTPESLNEMEAPPKSYFHDQFSIVQISQIKTGDEVEIYVTDGKILTKVQDTVKWHGGEYG